MRAMELSRLSPPDTTFLLRASLLVVLFAGVCVAAEPPAASPTESLDQGLRKAMLLPPDTSFVYHDEQGAPLTAEEFSRRLQTGVQFDVARDDVAKSATLTLMPPAAPTSEIGAVTYLPPLDLQDLYGRRLRNLDLAGRPTLINFFYENCVPCIKEAPVLTAYRRRHAEFNYLAVTFDSRDAAKRFVQRYKLDWPVAYDGKPFIDAAQVKGYPTYLLVASDGRILGRGTGMDTRSMEDPVRALGEFEKWVSGRLSRRE
jgi:thiol-disulfide isomerase/thioredoxin